MNDNLKKPEGSDSEEEGEIRLSEIEHPSLQVTIFYCLIPRNYGRLAS
jgi:hypothetical protein